MIHYFINRGGKNRSARCGAELERAKPILHQREAHSSPTSGQTKAAAKKR
jgi:hypothetical protein